MQYQTKDLSWRIANRSLVSDPELFKKLRHPPRFVVTRRSAAKVGFASSIINDQTLFALAISAIPVWLLIRYFGKEYVDAQTRG